MFQMRLLQSLICILLLCLATAASAQNLSDIDFQTVNVDDLSEQQIQRIHEEAQSRNMSIEQVTQLAVARGLPKAQANRLRQRLQQVQGGQLRGGEGGAEIPRGRLRTSPTLGDTTGGAYDVLFGADTESDTLEMMQTIERIRYQSRQDSIQLHQQILRDKIFGYSLFRERGQVNFEPELNIPTPSDYQFSTGDEVIIDIWGAAQQTYQQIISPDGTINIPNLGPIYLNGMTIEEASRRLKDRLGTIYSGLNPQDESRKDTYMQVSLGQIRSIKVTVLGEAMTPGTYTVPSLATVFNALYAAGGPTTTGSFRNIDVIRGDSVAATFDLYDLLIDGDQSANIRLRSQDIIQIHPYDQRVEISGEVKRPGIYELRENETLQNLIKYAGDFTNQAYTDRVKVIGNTPKEKQITDVNQQNFDRFMLSNGDSITVGEILDRFSNRVKIEGAVFRPGEYEVTDTTSLYSLIQRADGLMGDAFLNRGLIYRTRDDYSIEAISFNVRELLNNPEEHDIPLQKDDLVRISSIFDMQENYTVRINGPVQNPTRFEFAYGMTLEDLIFKAGGFRESATPNRVEVARRIRDLEGETESSSIAEIFSFEVDENLRLSPEDAKFELQPFDQVYVRTLPNYEAQQEVTVIGEIKYPGKYTISSRNERISDLIRRAGGLTPEAYTQGATLFRQREFTQQRGQRVLANIEGLTQEEQEEQLRRQEADYATAQVGIDLPEVMNNPESRHDLFLERGDSLFIPKQLQTVTIQGGVFHPTTTRFREGSNFKDYITAAGGYTDLAKKRRAYVIYPSGDVDRVKSFLFFKNHPEVEPGATIVVPEDPDPIRLSPQERIGIMSTITSTAVLIVTTVIQITR